MSAAQARLVVAFTESALPGLVDGSLRPIVDRVYHVEDVAAAHRYVESNDSIGKVILTWNRGMHSQTKQRRPPFARHCVAYTRSAERAGRIADGPAAVTVTERAQV